MVLSQSCCLHPRWQNKGTSFPVNIKARYWGKMLLKSNWLGPKYSSTCCVILNKSLALSKNIGVGSHFPLYGIFLTQGLNPGLLHCRQIPYHLSHMGRPSKLQLIQQNKTWPPPPLTGCYRQSWTRMGIKGPGVSEVKNLHWLSLT